MASGLVRMSAGPEPGLPWRAPLSPGSAPPLLVGEAFHRLDEMGTRSARRLYWLCTSAQFRLAFLLIAGDVLIPHRLASPPARWLRQSTLICEVGVSCEFAPWFVRLPWQLQKLPMYFYVV